MSSAGFPISDPTVIQKDHLISLLRGRNPMGNEKDDFVMRPRADILEHFVFGFNVKRGSRFVKNQNRGSLENRTCDRDSLPLSRRELGASLA